MTRQWCYTRNGRITLGPVSFQELRRMVQTGQLRPTDVVGEVGMRYPRRAGDVEGLFVSEEGSERASPSKECGAAILNFGPPPSSKAAGRGDGSAGPAART